MQKLPPELKKNSYEQTSRIDYSDLMPTESKKDRELEFLLTKMSKKQEVCLHEFDNIKNAIFQYLSKFKQEIGNDNLALQMQILDQWDSEIYGRMTEENRDVFSNLQLFANLNPEKIVKIRVEHCFAWNFFKNERKFVENLNNFATMLKINNNIVIGEFSTAEIMKKIELIKKFKALSFSLSFEAKIYKKIFINICLKVEKHTNFDFLQGRNINLINDSSFWGKISANKSIIPCGFGVNLAKKGENLLCFQFFGNFLKKKVISMINQNFSDLKHLENLINSLKAKEFVFQAKFEKNSKLLEWELLYRQKNDEDDEMINSILKNKNCSFLMKNTILSAKKIEIGLNFDGNSTFLVRKFGKIRANENKNVDEENF